MGASEDGDRLVNGRYRLIEVIGRGGMGTVWHGHDELLDREVAIKEVTLSPDLDESERAELSALAVQEARATARLSHPGIITIFDVIDDEGVPTIVMELLEGRSLADLLKEEVRLPYGRVAEIGAAMLDALREAHAAGIVHRDLKPANVLITDRRVVLTDFGVAQRVGERADEPGDVTGTPAFMAPEQAENAAASPAADLWALGATLFNAVEGKPPYQGPDYATVLLTLLTQEPPAPVRAGPLAPVISALLRKDPARRPAADQVAEELAAILVKKDGDGPAALPAGSPSPRPTPKPPATPPPPANATAPSPRPVRPPSRIVPIMGSGPAARPKPELRAGGSSVRPRRRQPGRPGMIIAAVIAIGLVTLYIVTHLGSSGSSPSSLSSSYDPLGGLPGGGLPGVPSATPSSPAGTSEAPKAPVVVRSTAFSPDGKTVAFGAAGVVRLYDTATHESRRSLKASEEVVKVTVLDFSPDGRSLAAELDDGTVNLWDLRTRKKPKVLDQGNMGDALGFSADGRTLTALGSNGAVTRWDLRTGKPSSSTIPLPADTFCDRMAVSQNGRDVACDYSSGQGDGELFVWDTWKSKKTNAWPDGSQKGLVLMFSPDGKSLVFSDSSGRLELWDIASHRRTRRLDSAVISDTSAFSPDGGTLAELSLDIGRREEAIGIWKLADGRKVAAIPSPEGLHALALGAGGTMLATAADGGGALWSVKSHKKLASWTA